MIGHRITTISKGHNLPEEIAEGNGTSGLTVIKENKINVGSSVGLA